MSYECSIEEKGDQNMTGKDPKKVMWTVQLEEDGWKW